jgi:uncharacterized membrane protein YdjX (TVP38/TMEM64 family)
MAEDGRSKRPRLRMLALLAGVSSSGLVMTLLVSPNAQGLAGTISDLRGPELVLMIAAIAVLSIALTPAALLSAAAGYVAGIALGTAVALCGLTLGALACAQIARLAGGEDGATALGPGVERLALWVRTSPTHSIVVARLVPGVPFHLLSYAAGFSGVRFSAIAVGTAIGFAPRCFLFAALGGSLGSLDRPETRAALVLSVLALIVSYVAMRRRFLDDRPDLLPRVPGQRFPSRLRSASKGP